MILFYQGEAGTGKTYELISATINFVRENKLLPYQRILALTFMHGSRKRLLQRLSQIKFLSTKYECSTIDSFAYQLLLRWRSFFINQEKEISISKLSYDDICARTAELLDEVAIRNWIKRKYPLIIIDEMQDCKNKRLEIIKNLSKTINIYAAADSFQDLDTDDTSNEATEWLISASVITALRTIHRTDKESIIELSRKIRNSEKIIQNKANAYIGKCYNENGAAHSIARNIAFSYATCKEHVILTPTKPESSIFIKNTLDIITTQKLNVVIRRNPLQKKELGPYSFNIIKSEEELCDSIKEDFKISPDKKEYKIEEIQKLSSYGINKFFNSWVKRKKNVLGKVIFSYDELDKNIGLYVHTYRAYYEKDISKFSFMTIHQAKNREFEHVIILWPYEVQGTETKKRKLLYNAVTRAIKRVDVIVLDPNDKILISAPFN